MSETIEIPQQKTFADIGLDTFGQSPLQFTGPEVNKKVQSTNDAAVPPPLLQSGDLTQQFTMTAGFIKSQNYSAGLSGWKINADGTSEFN
jgi:hypothetical protein